MRLHIRSRTVGPKLIALQGIKMSKVIDILTREEKTISQAKINECLRTKIVRVKRIDSKQLDALQARGFMVILKGDKP